MKLVSYFPKAEHNAEAPHQARTGLLITTKEGYEVYDLHQMDASLPTDMTALLADWERNWEIVWTLEGRINAGDADDDEFEPIEGALDRLAAPVPNPTSCRDGYAFRQHVASARRNRKVDMIPEFDQYPIFYFTNHNAIVGPGKVTFMPDHFQKLDYELEVAIVIGKQGRNIKANEADAYIAGFMVMNDWSARTLQMEEMVLNLGPAKGKDFATGIGPFLLTREELEPYRVAAKPGHTGAAYDLEMTARINGVEYSRGNVKDMDWTFAEIIERVSYGVDIFPGDVIGSGTVGTGCLLELNGTGLLEHPTEFRPYWLQPGDVVECEVAHLGVLRNTIAKVDTDHSLLALKKV